MEFNEDQSNWPCYIQGDDMLEKVELKYPGFTKKWNEKAKKKIDRPIVGALHRRIHYTNDGRREDFGIPTTPRVQKGMSFPF